jgi:hypothetical protein
MRSPMWRSSSSWSSTSAAALGGEVGTVAVDTRDAASVAAAVQQVIAGSRRHRETLSRDVLGHRVPDQQLLTC